MVFRATLAACITGAVGFVASAAWFAWLGTAVDSVAPETWMWAQRLMLYSLGLVFLTWPAFAIWMDDDA